jgi:hypothetical protein
VKQRVGADRPLKPPAPQITFRSRFCQHSNAAAVNSNARGAEQACTLALDVSVAINARMTQ